MVLNMEDDHTVAVIKSNVNRTCMYGGCPKRASFGSVTDSKPKYCKHHKEPSMSSHDPRHCASSGCRTRPNYSLPSERLPTHCIKHKTNDMVSKDNRRCRSEKGCSHRARFAPVGQVKPLYCLSHKGPSMINVTRQVCEHPGCNKYPCYGTPDTDKGVGYLRKRMTHCVHHHLPGMVNVKQKICKGELCTAYAHNPKETKGLCSRCYVYMFPAANKSRRFKTKETATCEFLKQKLPQTEFLRDQIVSGGCSKYRPDILCDLVTHVLIIEIDENQHDAYDQACENKRLVTLWGDLAHRPLVLIRFNPDAYMPEGSTQRVTSCFRHNSASGLPFVPASKKEEWSKRLDDLYGAVRNAMQKVPDRSITVQYLFYDGYTNESL